MMSTLEAEALATLQEAERLLDWLAPESADRQVIASLVADLRDLCAGLLDGGAIAGPSLARARETIYAAQAHLRILRSRHERADAAT